MKRPRIFSPKGTGKIKRATGSPGSRILGVGGYRPERVVPNSEIVEAIQSSDAWIQERSGIVERRFARPDETVVDMSYAAAKDAIAMAGLDQSEIDAIIMATVTHPYQTPAAAPLLADRLDLRCAAFDISAACAGYCHAVSLASDMVRGGSATNVLVVGVEKLTDFTDFTDRSTAFIFGDGAGAAVIGRSDHTGIGATVWGSEGDSWSTIQQRESWVELRGREGVAWPAIKMEGHKVFRWAVWGMAPVAQRAMEAAGVKPSDLDAFIPHQANMRIIDAMLKQLKLPKDIVVARDIATTANTSAASIPLATERLLREGLVPHGGLALQIGFGAGLVYAAQVVELP
ncbi:MAG: ketoacyl-ACP synthase III [Tetrasphaera sp.]|jgi:3-oxoacyl-[acyl-carrier-protein] synthase-3|nr:ketoacyl-ACP synthase III [Tetrasphaera sp.]